VNLKKLLAKALVYAAPVVATMAARQIEKNGGELARKVERRVRRIGGGDNG
jgi:hypothetical protein